MTGEITTDKRLQFTDQEMKLKEFVYVSRQVIIMNVFGTR
jgi:hypothetical protein